MDMNEYFSLVRKQRKMPLQKLSLVAGSPASISDFENGHTSLSLNTLLLLLEELQIELPELLNNNSRPNSLLHQQMAKAQYLIDQCDFNSLKKEINELEKKYSQQPNLKYFVLIASLKLIIAESTHEPVNQELVDQLIDYFWNVNVWTNFDIAMFGNTVSFFSSATITSFCLEILKTLNCKQIENHLQIIKIDTAINGLLILITRREHQESIKLFNYLNTFILSTNFLYERLYIEVCQLLIAYYWGNKKNVILKKEKYLSCLSIVLDENERAELESLLQLIT